MLLSKASHSGLRSGAAQRPKPRRLAPVTQRRVPCAPLKAAQVALTETYYQQPAPTLPGSAQVLPSGLTILPPLVHAPAPAPKAPKVASKCTVLTPDTFHTFLEEAGEHQLVLVDFYTDWCGPCKAMMPELEKIAGIFKQAKFGKINCGTYNEFATRARVRSLPTFRLYKHGRVLDELTGAKPVALRQAMMQHYREV